MTNHKKVNLTTHSIHLNFERFDGVSSVVQLSLTELVVPSNLLIIDSLQMFCDLSSNEEVNSVHE